MRNNKGYLLLTRCVLSLIFVVILAGSVVRTTHSGMGCPDWPRCFGRWIPPMNAGQLPPDYEKYLSRQDIDHSFNAFHTWVEYINRLCTVLLVAAIIVLIIWSFRKFWQTRPVIAKLSVWLLIGVIIESLLGWLIVHTNLNVDTVTIHLIPIFFLAGICVVIIHKVQGNYKIQDTGLQRLSTAALIAILVQILLGTQVREGIDLAGKALQYEERGSWVQQVGSILTVHEVFAWAAAVICVYLFWRGLSYSRLQKLGFFLLLLVILELAMGFTLVKIDFPAFAQPAHLLLASGILMTLFSYRLHLGTKK